MEQLLKIPVSRSWEIPSLKCPMYSSLVSGRLFLLRHFILFTVISKSISFQVESIYHIPIFLSPHLSHWHSAKFIRVHVFLFLLFLSSCMWSLERY